MQSVCFRREWVESTWLYGSTTAVATSGTQPTSAYTGNQIGTRERSSGAFFNGKVYNMVVYNRSLSDTEIAQNWTALSF